MIKKILLAAFLLLGAFFFYSLASAYSISTTLYETEKMSRTSGSSVINNASASGGKVVKSAINGSVARYVTIPSSPTTVKFTVKMATKAGSYPSDCKYIWPSVGMSIGGVPHFSSIKVTSSNWKVLAAPILVGPGRKVLVINFSETTARTRCGKYLYMDAVSISSKVASPTTATAGVVGSLTTVRPLDHPSTSSSASIKAVSGSFESFQVVVDNIANSTTAPNIDMSMGASALSDGSGHTIANSKFTIYREGYTTISLPSDNEMYSSNPCTSNCKVPDALIPKVDYLYNEARNAFPITVPAHENRVAWIDLQIPAGQAPGVYTGATIKVTSNGVQIASIPITVEVFDFDMPATSSLGGAIGITPSRICGTASSIYANCTVGSGIPSNITGGAWQTYQNYARAALENRVGLARPSYLGPAADLTKFRTYAEPLLDGTATRTSGQKITDILLNASDSAGAGDWKTESTSHSPAFTAKISYYCDEFGDAQWQSACGDGYDTANTNWQNTGANIGALPNASIGTISHLNAGIGDSVEAAQNTKTLIPIVNYMDPYNSGSTRATYDSFANTAGNRLWMYTSCMSVGCGTSYTPEADWVGWPALSGIDQPASEERAMGWQDFNYKATGDYYFESLQNISKCTNWNTGTSPTDCMFNEGGNGDGTLFYPGYTSQVGGTHDIPIETIRLKRYRDGRQDYELLQYLANQCSGACSSVTESQVRDIAGGPYASTSGLFPTLSQSNVSQSTFDAKRNALLSLLP